jgi:BirA family biotin operon repressor/biotin-[acetyl-CoA-carboxylase] ligase
MNPISATSAARFLPISTKAAGEVGPGPLHHVTETGSTNADLAEQARRGDATAVVLVADHQTAGRGRLDRKWDDDPGTALLASFRVPADATTASRAVQALGAAARAAIDGLCTRSVLMKWPNDLVVLEGPSPGKLAGVLAEFVAEPTPCVVIGIGINIAPIRRQPGATSVNECGGADDRDVVLAALLREFAPRLEDWAGVLSEVRENSATLGARVRVELPGGDEVVGVAIDVTADGQLVVDDDEGSRHVVATADVVHLRPD